MRVSYGRRTMIRYEYVVGGFSKMSKIEEQQLKLNEMGERGYDLVSVVANDPVTGHVGEGSSGYLLFYFKRRKKRRFGKKV
jgi:hypothetical protein